MCFSESRWPFPYFIPHYLCPSLDQSLGDVAHQPEWLTCLLLGVRVTASREVRLISTVTRSVLHFSFHLLALISSILTLFSRSSWPIFKEKRDKLATVLQIVCTSDGETSHCITNCTCWTNILGAPICVWKYKGERHKFWPLKGSLVNLGATHVTRWLWGLSVMRNVYMDYWETFLTQAVESW